MNLALDKRRTMKYINVHDRFMIVSEIWATQTAALTSTH